MILNSIDTQFKLAEDGQVTWQKDLTNPMPGVAIGRLEKGESLLTPKVGLIADAAPFEGKDLEAATTFINEWLSRHLQSALEPLFKMKEADIPEGAPKDICAKLFDALGILPREELQDLIGQMDEEMRASLRSKKIRFGPLIVYLPELNKPASVRLRALLLSLWQDKTLPAVVPADGIVSFSVEGKDIEPTYYRSIGYPVYGPRAIRVDMLDRVVCAVYDSADAGKFNAQHQMAEWLGSNIADLYAVLEAMGHKKIHDPADEIVAEVKEEGAPAAVATEEVKEGAETSEAVPVADKPKETVPAVKPVLATFVLKKGKAISAPASASVSASANKNKFEGQKFKSKPKAKAKPHKKANKPKETGQRVYKAEAQSNPDDSPFAILQQLKTAQKD